MILKDFARINFHRWPILNFFAGSTFAEKPRKVKSKGFWVMKVSDLKVVIQNSIKKIKKWKKNLLHKCILFCYLLYFIFLIYFFLFISYSWKSKTKSSLHTTIYCYMKIKRTRHNIQYLKIRNNLLSRSK